MELLVESQATSLEVFLCNRYSSSCKNLDSALENLNDLSIQSMDPIGDCRYAAIMIIDSSETLNHLSLGCTTRIAQDFFLKRPPRYDHMSSLFAEEVADALPEGELESLIDLSLETLDLCGLDIGRIVRGESGLRIDFSNIKELKLESCSGLSQAFSLLTGQGDSSRLALSALEDLSVRVEDPDLTFSNSFQSFLKSIRGLIHLKVLIDKVSSVQDLEPILKVHGKTLKTLMWDERSGPRIDLSDTSLVPTRIGRPRNLQLISQNCTSLSTLGIPLDWAALNGPDFQRDAVTLQSVTLYARSHSDNN